LAWTTMKSGGCERDRLALKRNYCIKVRYLGSNSAKSALFPEHIDLT